MIRVTLLIFSFLFCTNLLASSDIICLERGKIKYLLNGKEKVERSDYCFNQKTGHLLKKSCFKTNCEANSIKGKTIPKKFSNGSFGNPVFKVCRHLGGSPQIIHIWTKKKWKKSSRCNFSDKSFIDNDTLYNYQKF